MEDAGAAFELELEPPRYERLWEYRGRAVEPTVVLAVDVEHCGVPTSPHGILAVGLVLARLYSDARGLRCTVERRMLLRVRATVREERTMDTFWSKHRGVLRALQRDAVTPTAAAKDLLDFLEAARAFAAENGARILVATDCPGTDVGAINALLALHATPEFVPTLNKHAPRWGYMSVYNPVHMCEAVAGVRYAVCSVANKKPIDVMPRGGAVARLAHSLRIQPLSRSLERAKHNPLWDALEVLDAAFVHAAVIAEADAAAAMLPLYSSRRRYVRPIHAAAAAAPALPPAAAAPAALAPTCT